MNSAKETARIAGLLHLVNGVTGFFGIVYVPSRLIVSGNAAGTVHNILTSERLFRLGIVSELICAAEFIFLVWALYRLLADVNKTHAALMVIWGLAFVPVMRLNVLSEIGARRSCATRISCLHSTGRNAKDWPCCSSTCIATGMLLAGSLALGPFTSGFLYTDRVSSPASWASC